MKMMPAADVTPFHCLACGTQMNAVTGVGSNPALLPEEGSVSVCWCCADVAFFDGKGGLRAPTPQERAELDASPELRAIRTAMLQRIAARKGSN